MNTGPGHHRSSPPEGMRIRELVRELRTQASIIGDAEVVVKGVRHDSRAIRPGDIFVVRRGQRSDGAAHIDEAIRLGAVALLAERGQLSLESSRVPLVLVDDLRLALAFGAAAVYGHPGFSLDVIGVTGTNGKTTVTHLVRAALDAAQGHPVCATLGTVGVAFGDYSAPATHTTPEADELARVFADLKTRGATFAAMEVSSHALAQGRVLGVRFHVAAFTNLTQDHLDFHGTMAAYGEAKAKLFRELAPATAVINVDDAFGAQLAASLSTPVVRVSRGPRADVSVRSVEQSRGGTIAVFDTPRGPLELESPLIGGHNVENLAVTVGVSVALGLDLSLAAAGLRFEHGAPGRMQRCEGAEDDITVVVDYAHTPDALARVLDAARTVCTGKILCVFGCGGDRDPAKRGPMGREVGLRADVCIVTNDNPRSESPEAIAASVVEGLRSSGRELVSDDEIRATLNGAKLELDRSRAIHFAVLAAKAGDIVVVAGKGHESYQITGDSKVHFSDVEQARAALRARRGG